MRRIAIESPLNGDFVRNLRYARLCALDCVERGEAPYGSHLFFPQFLNDASPDQRETGIRAGFAWSRLADVRAFYLDLGESKGMVLGRAEAERRGQLCENRYLPLHLADLSPSDADALATPGAVDSLTLRAHSARMFEIFGLKLPKAEREYWAGLLGRK